MSARPDGRRSRIVALVGTALLLLVLVLVYRLVVHRPAWWADAGDASPRAQARGAATENAVVRELTRVRGPEPWGFVLGEEDVNAWLVNRLEPWSRSQGRTVLPEGITDPRIRFADGWIEVGVLAAQGGAEILVVLRLDPTLEDGRLRIDVAGGGDGIASLLTSAMVEAFGDVGSDESTVGPGSILEPVVPLTDGRRVVIEDFEIVPGELAVRFRTDRP